ncbi:hypothetical protein ANN_08410 [Periplaneta americana]|uniref:Uncharacterized protein n=1 Tax=Periplaneta americana TaxID=6978 RepID=A0ABQ8T2H7_PERAM|nr:hypothetical protein ANN_08410 [Periplaneta americana]
MSPGSSTEIYPEFARIGLKENPGKNLNQAERELQELLNRVKDEKSLLANDSLTISKWNLTQYLQPQVLKPFFIIHIFNLIQVVCGTNLFIFYAVDIISGLKTDGGLDINLTTNLTSIVRVVFMAASCITLVWVGRRTMSISSGVGSGVAAVILGTLVHFQNVPAWFMIVFILLYVAFNTYGFFVLPPSMIGEILPSKIRCVLGAYIFTMNDIAMFVATKVFPSVSRTIGAEAAGTLQRAAALALGIPRAHGGQMHSNAHRWCKVSAELCRQGNTKTDKENPCTVTWARLNANLSSRHSYRAAKLLCGKQCVREWAQMLWGFIKSIVAQERYDITDELKDAMRYAFQQITPAMLRRMSHRTLCIILCEENDGGHIDPLDA